MPYLGALCNFAGMPWTTHYPRARTERKHKSPHHITKLPPQKERVAESRSRPFVGAAEHRIYVNVLSECA